MYLIAMSALEYKEGGEFYENYLLVSPIMLFKAYAPQRH